MFSHESLATEGLGPRVFKHFRCASLGFDFEIEVIVTPVSSTGGGGGGGSIGWLPDLNRYEVTVKIRYKKKHWSQTRQLNSIGLASLEKVIVSFTVARKIINNTKIYANYVTHKILNSIHINIRSKYKDES